MIILTPSYFLWKTIKKKTNRISFATIVLRALKVKTLAVRLILFVCVEVLRLSQPNGVMSSAVSLPNHTVTGQV